MYTQSGRSMVEMLGVLAIIGVLSIGAIAGYSKAMFKYRLNKQTEQLNTVVNAVARNVHSFNNMRKSEDYSVVLTPYFIKLGEIPKEMIKSGVSTEFYDVFNSKYDVIMEPSYNWIILYINPPLATRSEQNLDICRNMIITIKENAGDISYLQTLHSLGGDNYAFVTYWGDKYCVNGEPCVRDMTLEDIYEMCTKHIGQTGTHMKIGWYL